jgi:hypothetical protein
MWCGATHSTQEGRRKWREVLRLLSKVQTDDTIYFTFELIYLEQMCGARWVEGGWQF